MSDDKHKVEIECRVVKVLRGYFCSDKRKIELGSRLIDDLRMDSISVVEVIMELNDAFDVELDGAGVAEWRTVDDICRSIRSCKEH